MRQRPVGIDLSLVRQSCIKINLILQMVHSISGRPVDQDYRRKLYKHNKMILIVCVIACCLGNLPMGLLALLCLMISYRKYNAGRFVEGMGWGHGALALAVVGIILAIGVWICFIMWLAKWKFPWNIEDSYYS